MQEILSPFTEKYVVECDDVEETVVEITVHGRIAPSKSSIAVAEFIEAMMKYSDDL